MRGLTTGVTHTNTSTYCWCLDWKQTRLPLKEIAVKDNHTGGAIHSYFCVPMQVRSISGKIYFVTFVDVCSGVKSIYLVPKKSEMLKKFKMFHAMFERRHGSRIKRP